jgi:hypothetical protein
MADPSVVGDRAATVLIDGERFEATAPQMTGAQILALAGLDAGRARLFAEGHHGLRIGAQDVVPVQDGSRFRTERA